jgi:hypothetical protein
VSVDSDLANAAPSFAWLNLPLLPDEGTGSASGADLGGEGLQPR